VSGVLLIQTMKKYEFDEFVYVFVKSIVNVKCEYILSYVVNMMNVMRRLIVYEMFLLLFFLSMG